MKVYDQSDTEVDSEVFEEIVKESPGAFRIMLGSEGLGNLWDHSQTGWFSVKADVRLYPIKYNSSM